ncbi:MAG: hypothetical protein FWD35_02115 [Oscillospiraceae bacterium]|nr:hypothetical protein [Oscillospiraceae bacterium]
MRKTKKERSPKGGLCPSVGRILTTTHLKPIAAILLVISLCFALVSCDNQPAPPDIKIGAKDFTEQYILAHMFALLIEGNTNLTAAVNYNLASEVIFASVRTGVIDLYVEYTGTIYGSYLHQTEQKLPHEIYDIASREIAQRHDLQLLPVLGFDNTFALAVTQELAQQHNLRTISDLAKVSQDMVFGGGAEILVRNDGLPNLKRLYQLEFAEELNVDALYVSYGMSRYTALADDDIQVTEVFATDGILKEHNLVVLEDDKNYWLAYEGAVVIRNDILEKHPQLADILNKLVGLLTGDVMRDLNHKADILGEAPRDVAEAFLRENNLI